MQIESRGVRKLKQQTFSSFTYKRTFILLVYLAYSPKCDAHSIIKILKLGLAKKKYVKLN